MRIAAAINPDESSVVICWHIFLWFDLFITTVVFILTARTALKFSFVQMSCKTSCSQLVTFCIPSIRHVSYLIYFTSLVGSFRKAPSSNNTLHSFSSSILLSSSILSVGKVFLVHWSICSLEEALMWHYILIKIAETFLFFQRQKNPSE